MEEIYLIPKVLESYEMKPQIIYIGDIYFVYPKNYEEIINNIIIRDYKENISKYDVIHLGEVIEAIKIAVPKIHINFLKKDDVIIYFKTMKKDRTKYFRVGVVSIVVMMGSIMGIMNFHADVNMSQSQSKMVGAITNDTDRYLPYFQIPYSLGIGLGVALFFNKVVPTYSKDEPSPLDLRMISLNKEIENQIRIRGR